MNNEIDMTMPKLLIIDDDPGIRSQLKWGLEGFDVITADSRLNAIEQFEQHRPPLVTLDLGLPPNAEGTSEGFAMLKHIIENAPQTKVVVVSGAEQASNADKARKGGAFDFRPKPVELAELQQLIDSAYTEFRMTEHD